MDAIDALMCLGFVVGKTNPHNEYQLIGHPCYLEGSIEHVVIKSLFKEIGQQPEYHQKLIQQKGIALGT